MTSTSPHRERKFRNMAELFWHRISDTPELEAFRYPVGESWSSLTWKQTGDRVGAIASGLLALGIQREDRCAIWSSTRVEWILVDFGILCAGGATTTVYPSTPPDDCVYILKDSASRVVFVESDAQIEMLRARRDELPDLFQVITLDGKGDGDWVISLSELEDRGRAHAKDSPDALQEIARTMEAESLATLIYTSGTTGKPKGVRLVHDCWTYTSEHIDALGILDRDDLQYLWLPLSHSFGKVLLGAQVCVGFPTAVDGRLDKIVDNLAVVRPKWMGAAPRIFEKVHNRVVANAQAGGAVKYRIFKWAMGVGREVSRLRQAGREPGGFLALKNAVADKLVFSKLRERFGGRIKFFISGSAPLSGEIAEFFHAAGILILEGYGLTETSAASFVNRPHAYRFGTVGLPLGGMEVRIAEEDGEILIRSPGVMRGYHNLPDKTAEVLSDGWMHTGDIGELDDDGFLRITDRKKDLIKTSGGKYVAPQLIEGRFKTLCPLVSQIVVHGDRRNYCTALIALDPEALTAWAETNGLAGKSYQELTQEPRLQAAMDAYVAELNKGLASFETIKQFSILPHDLTIEEGELTPSLKVKRKHVEAKYKDTLDAMYTDSIKSL